MHPAPLPTGTLEYDLNGAHQAHVRVADYELHLTQTSGFEIAEELGSERFGLSTTHLEAKDLPAPFNCNTDRVNGRLGDHPLPDPRFAIGGIDEHVRVGGVIEPAPTDFDLALSKQLTSA